MAEVETTIMRAHLAATWFSVCLQASQDLFGRGYLSLSVPEKLAVDRAVLEHIAALIQTTTPEALAAHTAQVPKGPQAPIGTQPPSPTASQDTTTDSMRRVEWHYA
jgi:hypothetical protein